MRRDLDIDCDPAQLVLNPPDRSQLKEIFRRFEFRNLLNRVDELDVRVPSAPLKVTGVEVPWREGELDLRGVVGFALDGDRAAVAVDAEVSRRPAALTIAPQGELVVHDAKSLRVDARDDTLLAAYLIDPGRASYELDDLAAEYGVELLPTPTTDEETVALVRRAETPRRLVGPLLERLEERNLTELYRTGRACRSPACSPKWSTRASRSTPTGWARSRPASPSGSTSSKRSRTSSRAASS